MEDGRWWDAFEQRQLGGSCYNAVDLQAALTTALGPQCSCQPRYSPLTPPNHLLPLNLHCCSAACIAKLTSLTPVPYPFT